jgi:hypothetical protein
LDPTLPFRLEDGMVWVGARVKGHDVSGILDSDSDKTFIDTQTAEKLGLQNPKARSASVSGEPGESEHGVSFDLGPSVLLAPRPTILPIRNQIPGMDFILGFDAIGKTPFTVDYSKSVIRLGTLPQGRRVPFLSGRDVPSTRVSFSNIDLNSVVDTGAPAGLDIPFPWIKSMLPSVQFEQPVGRKDLGPRYEALPFMINELLVGVAKLSNVKAAAVRRKDNPLENRGDNWATIGNLILSRFAQIGIDGPNRNCVFVI